MTLKVGRMVVFTALATAARQVLACRRSLSTPQSYAFSLISLLFPPVFFEERESWREGFLDLLTKAKCKEKRG